MPNETKQKVRPLYSEFQGYLSQAPDPSVINEAISDHSVWGQYNEAVDLLSTITGQDFGRFKAQPIDNEFIYVNTYRQKLGGLISRLHGEFFSDEPAPFSGMPSMVVTQTQQQSMSVQMLLDVQSAIDEALPRTEDGSKQQGFLKKFKSLLSSVKDANQLISLFIKTAKDVGLTIDDIAKLWGG